MMKKTIVALMALLMLCSCAFACQAEDTGFIRVENGMLQPVLQWSDLRAENYTNEGSDILRFCVWVETDHDTDLDGKADLVKALVQVPRAAAEGRRLLREKPFILGIPYRELEPESESDETVLVQGIIDLYFEEADGLILVDYKTDHVKDAAELIRRYRTQLSYYSRALAAASDKIVKEIYIYSTCLRRFIPLEPLR